MGHAKGSSYQEEIFWQLPFSQFEKLHVNAYDFSLSSSFVYLLLYEWLLVWTERFVIDLYIVLLFIVA